MIAETETIQVESAPIKYWVTMTDKFMSGWGKANRKINKLVITCETYKQAVIVEGNALNRSEMKYVNICTKKPYYNEDRYLVSWGGKAFGDYGFWFKENYFKNN